MNLGKHYLKNIFLKFLNKIFNLKLNLKKITWAGNDISKSSNFLF